MSRTTKTAVYMMMGWIMAFGAALSAHAADEDAGHGKDYRTFHQDGTIDYGEIGDSYTADLVMYLAGNQFMVMEELIGDFLASHPDIKTVYVETIPPGQILKQIMAGGEIDGHGWSRRVETHAQVELGGDAGLLQRALEPGGKGVDVLERDSRREVSA